jgi:hypothetical protein
VWRFGPFAEKPIAAMFLLLTAMAGYHVLVKFAISSPSMAPPYSRSINVIKVSLEGAKSLKK